MELSQAASLAWLARAHAQSEATLSGLDDAARDAFELRMQRIIGHCACGSDRIARRGFCVEDVTRADGDGAEIYDLARHPHGAGMGDRTRVFGREASRYFRDAYADESEAPADLVHVTCTGYASPSAAQLMVEEHGWGARTRVTHAYQMGCYAAVPALRIARGFVLADDTPNDAAPRTDIVHTELCSLHLDPTDHAPEQLVIQSLFGDGLIRYSLSAGEEQHSFELLALSETLVPGSADAMSWVASEWGMRMTLARDVPARVAASLRAFVSALFANAGLDVVAELSRSVFAVHPGGPKIIDEVRRLLELREDQVAASRRVLHDFGNMSSATLPHVWRAILADDAVPSGTLVPSVAFGPGLTICGSLFRKR